MSPKRFLAVPMLLLGLLAGSAQAAVVLDSYGPFTAPLTLDHGTDTQGQHYEQSHAVRFTLTGETKITSIQAAIDNLSGTGKLTLGIMASVSDEFAAELPSGKLLYSSELTGVVSGANLSNLNWTLGAGTYWLTGSAYNADATWTSGFFAEHAISNTPGTWTGGYTDIFSPAALIEGTMLMPGGNGGVNPVPEPETYALMLAGVALVSFMSRRKRAA